MAKPELGTKRVCPTTGRKFYDLNKDPVVSPYTGEAFARTMFEPQTRASMAAAAAAAAAATDDDEDEVVADAGVELVSLDEAEAEETTKETTGDDDIDIEDDIVADDDDDDTFLAEEEEGDDDVADLIDGDLEDDEEV